MNIPFHYDLPNSHVVNKEISVLNSKLQKLVRVFPHTSFIVSYNDRKLFTKHGLHHNRLGNKLLTELGLHILTIFEHQALHPIPLGWYEPVMVDNLHCDSS
jgi:hypothetical protein